MKKLRTMAVFAIHVLLIAYAQSNTYTAEMKKAKTINELRLVHNGYKIELKGESKRKSQSKINQTSIVDKSKSL